MARSNEMKRLLLMRHAKPANPQDILDHDRPLNDQGLSEAPRVGQWLIKQGIRPDEVIASTALRAYTTAQLVADQFENPPHVQTTRSLYMPCVDDIVEAVSVAHGPTILVVCHNPGISEAATVLGGSPVSMSPASLAVIDFGVAAWSDLLVDASGDHHAIWHVRDLPAQ